MKRSSRVSSKKDSFKGFSEENSEMDLLKKKFKELNDSYNKLKKTNDGMKGDFEKQKHKFVKVMVIRTIES